MKIIAPNVQQKTIIWLALYLMFSMNSAQALNIIGRVYSAEDESPIVGARIEACVDSAKTITSTTNNTGGFFITFSDSSSSCNIILSCLGYEQQHLSIANISGDVDLGKILMQPAAQLLNEIEVTATTSKALNLPDKSIIFPTSLDKERATNPLNLITQVSYNAPMLSVNDRAETILIGGEPAQILINGVKRNYSQFNALNPKDILKVEYITYTDMRYGAPYINIITIKPPTGGSFMGQLSAPVTTRQENHQIYSSYLHGKHEISINYRGNYRDSRKEHRNEIEQYFYPGSIYENKLTGLPGRLLDRNHSVEMEYSLIGGPKKILTATAGLSYDSYYYRDKQLSEFGMNSMYRSNMRHSTKLNPSLNIYGSLPVGNNGRLEMNLSGAYVSGDFTRALSQTNGYADVTTTSSDSYVFQSDLYYEHRFSWSKFNAGFSHTYNKALNSYKIDGEPNKLSLEKNSTNAYAALSGQVSNIGYYYASIGLYHTKVNASEVSPYAYLMLQKHIRNFDLRYTVGVKSSSPGLSSYSDVLLPVNEIMYQSGNIKLKDAVTIRNQLYASYSYKKFTAEMCVDYLTTSNTPITVCNYIDDETSPIYGKFLQMTQNSRHYKDFSTILIIGFSNLADHYSIRIAGSYNNQSTDGFDHSWSICNFVTDGMVSAYFGPWQFNASTSLLPTYSLNGNTLWRNFTWWSIGASWHKDSWSISCDISDLFRTRAYYQERTTMAIGSTTTSKSWIADKNNWVSFTVRYQISFGKSADKPHRSISGSTQADTGVNANY